MNLPEPPAAPEPQAGRASPISGEDHPGPEWPEAGTIGNQGMVRMAEPDVREAPDAGAIHWHEQPEPGLADDEAAAVADAPDAGAIR